MSDPTPAVAPAPSADDPKKKLRDKIDALLASEPRKSTGSLAIGGRTLKYTAVAGFIPVASTSFDEKRGEPEAAFYEK